MNLLVIDKHSDIASPVHEVDSALKLVSFLVFVVFVVLLPSGSFVPLAVAMLTLLCVTLISRVPVRYVVSRTLTIIPFVLAIGVLNLLGRSVELSFHPRGTSLLGLNPGPLGIGVAWKGTGSLVPFLTMAAKSFVSLLGITLLVTTTGSARLLDALRRIGLPATLTVVIAFMLRYVVVVAEELRRTKRSSDSRRIGRPPLSVELRYLGSLAGALFIRSFERAERVYAAMCSRGFSGVVCVPARPPASARGVLFPAFLLGPPLLALLFF